MSLTEQFILMQAPNAAAAENGRKLSKKGSFISLYKTQDGSLYWGDCAGSGKAPYRTSIDFTEPEAPICRCSCPSRQFPCKHALGLMFEILAGKAFTEAEVPEEIARKRAGKAARAAQKEEKAADPPKPKRANKAAQAKKINKQLEGLDMAERMLEELLAAGLGTMSGASLKTYEKLAKDLGSYYLTGPQTAFLRIALAISELQRDPEHASRYYRQCMPVLISLYSLIKKARIFLGQKLEQQEFSLEDNLLFEALGGVWRLEDLSALGLVVQQARLLQLSFDVSYDAARQEYIDRGYWINLDTGEISATLNYRPVKALKYVRADDSCFDLLEVPALYYYPGGLNRRIRWEGCSTREPLPEELAQISGKAFPDIGSAVKLVKNQMKNTLSPKYAAVLLPYARIGRVGGQYVLEDPAGCRLLLRDRIEDGEDHRSVRRLQFLPDPALLEGGALFGLMFYDAPDRRICLHPYSLVSHSQIVRLQY